MKTLPRTFWQRLTGSCATPLADSTGWSCDGTTLTLDLTQLPQLTTPGNALRFEGDGLPQRVLVLCADDGSYHAVHNRCRHMSRRLDFVPGTETVQCCSINKSTWDFNGAWLQGPKERELTTYRVEKEGDELRVLLE